MTRHPFRGIPLTVRGLPPRGTEDGDINVPLFYLIPSAVLSSESATRRCDGNVARITSLWSMLCTVCVCVCVCVRKRERERAGVCVCARAPVCVLAKFRLSDVFTP